MSTRTVATLGIDVVTDAAKAAAGLDDVGEASKRMSTHVEQASASAERSARSFGVSAEAADDLGGKAGKATGALGALSSGFELVGAEKYAGALQGAALATDFFSGVGDSLNLVMESTIVKTTIARARTVALAVTQRAVAVATRTWAAVQWVLNAALTANPIGLVVAAIALLIAGIVLAYRRSESFRNIVDAVGRVGVAAFRSVVNWIGNVIDWIKRLPGWFEAVKDKASSIAGALTAPFRALWDFIGRIIERIKSIRLPSLGGVGKALGGLFLTGGGGAQPLAPAGGLGFAATGAQPLVGGGLGVGSFGGGSSSTGSSSGGGAVTIDARTFVELSGLIDRAAAGREVADVLADHRRRLGQLVSDL